MKGRRKQQKMAATFRPSGWTMLVRGLRQATEQIRAAIAATATEIKRRIGLASRDQYVLTSAATERSPGTPDRPRSSGPDEMHR